MQNCTAGFEFAVQQPAPCLPVRPRASLAHSLRLSRSVRFITLQGALTKVLLAGAVDGSVLAYDTAKMKLLWRKSLPYGAVSSIVSIEKNVLVMTGSGRAVVLDSRSGNELAQWTSPTNFQVTKVASLGDGRVLLGGSSIVMVDSTTGARLGKWTGHATPVISLSSCEQYFCSAATGDRTVAVWSTRKKGAVAQISLNHPVALVSMAMVSSAAEERYQVVAVTLSGDIHVFKYCSGSGQAVEWARSEGGDGGLPAVQVAIGSADDDSLEFTAAFGSVVKPRFARLKLAMPADGSVVEIEKPDGDEALRGEALVKSMEEGGGRGRRGQASSHVPLAVTETNELAILRGDRDQSEPFFSASEGDHMDLDGDVMSDGDSDGDHLERNLTFAERIAALKGSVPSGQHDPPGSSGKDPDKSQPKADSLAVLLSQALSNEDNALLERCLSVKSAKTVSKTARQLSPGDATTLVRMLVQKLQSSPRRAAELTTWMKAVLVHHAGYFSGTGACKESFSSLQQIIDARLSSYSSLVSLSGRLDLVLACARQSRQAAGGGLEGSGAFGRPLVSATIDEEGGIEVQDAAAAIGLDDDTEGDSEGDSEEDSEGDNADHPSSDDSFLN